MDNPTGFAVAIDGPVGVGKSTAAQQLAYDMGMTYIDTGAMYRAVALFNMRAGHDVNDESAIISSLEKICINLTPTGSVILNGEDVSSEIRNQALAEYTSAIAAYPAVRAKLTRQQKLLAENGEVVMDGRDIGSQVLPWAQVKIYLDAHVNIRAKRRQRELKAKGQPADFAQILEETKIRDERDKNRKTAPLIRTEDAVYIDASYMSPKELLCKITRLVQERKGN